MNVPRLLSLLLLLLLACGEPAERVEMHFAGLVDSQRDQVSSVEIGPGMPGLAEHLGASWYVLEENGEEALAMSVARAYLFFFSASGSPLGIAGAAAVDGGDREVRLLLNGASLGTVDLTTEWTTFRFPVPRGAARPGWNTLEVFPKRLAGERGTDVPFRIRMRQVKIDGTEDHLPRDRPVRIDLAEARGSSGPPAIVMPAGSFIDLALRLPREPEWIAAYRVERPGSGSQQRIEVRAELLDQRGVEYVLYEKVFAPRVTSRSLSIDLDRWRGQWVRLRLRTLGPGDAVITWSRALVRGRGSTRAVEMPGPVAPEAAPSSGRLGRPDVFVILLDAARADAFSTFGGPYRTPSLDELAVTGTRFSRALAPASWTGQTVPSLLSGLHPGALGIHHWGHRLPPGAPTIAEIFRQGGYETLLWSQHPVYRTNDSLRRGFERFQPMPSGYLEALPEAADLAALGEPIFGLFHFLPPHAPYEPPPPYKGSRTGWYGGNVPVDPAFLNDFPKRRDPADLSEDDRRYIRDRYLENALFADDLVGRLVARLRQAGRFGNAMIIVLSDHGEAFLEHGRFLHTKLLYDEFVRVPLVVKWPQEVVGHRPMVETTVSLVDIVPTLIDGVGLPADGRRFQGRSLLPQVFDGKAGGRAIQLATHGASRSTHVPWPLAALERNGWKAILQRVTGEIELYDLTADPGETTDLAPENPARAAWWAQEIRRHLEVNRQLSEVVGSVPEGGVLDPEVQEELKALGYL